jgi:hypothetical protein
MHSKAFGEYDAVRVLRDLMKPTWSEYREQDRFYNIVYERYRFCFIRSRGLICGMMRLLGKAWHFNSPNLLAAIS